MIREELIAALERAEGPSRELDAHIWKSDGCRVAPVPRYTSSLDAALTLVPEGEAWLVGWDDENHANVFVLPSPTSRPTGYHAQGAATPAIALCIAALKARA